MSLVARFIGVLTAPRATFASVAAHPKWFGMLAVTTLIVALFTALPLTREAGRQAAIDTQVESMKGMGFDVTDQMYEQMQKRSTMMPYTTGISILVISPIMGVIFSGILFAIFNAAMGGEASFKQVFTVLVHGGALTSVSSALTGIVHYFRPGPGSSVANVGALFTMLPENSFAAHLLGTIDLFLIWYFIILAIGLAVLYRRRTQPIAISLLSVYAVIALAIALFKSRGGGA
jgi:Yip1 domain